MLQSNISRYYLQKLAEFAVVFVVVGFTIYSFLGQSQVSDILHIVTLVGLSIFFHRDKNLVTILLIIVLGRLFPEVAFLLDSQSFWVKCTIYGGALYIFYSLLYDRLAKFSLALLFCMMVAEVYWWLTEYGTPPSIAYYITVAVDDLVVRHLLLKRRYIFSYLSEQLSQLPIDWQIYNLNGLFIPVVAILVIEYLLRHILGVQVLVIYNVYPHVISMINAAILWVILNYALKKTALFQA